MTTKIEHFTVLNLIMPLLNWNQNKSSWTSFELYWLLHVLIDFNVNSSQ